jgi:hypothetical protein
MRSRAEANRAERPAWVERCAAAARNPEEPWDLDDERVQAC